MSNPKDISDDDDDDDNDVPLMVRQKLVKLAQQRDDSLSPPSDEDCQAVASEHNVSVNVVREIFASTPRISASAAPAVEAEEKAAPKRGKRQSAIEASAFIQNNVNGEKDDDDGDDDDDDDNSDNERKKSGAEAASNNGSIDDEDFKPAASAVKREETGDLFSESLASTLNSKGGIKSIDALLQYTELMKSCSDARVVKNADKKRVVLLSPLLRTDVGAKEKNILNAVVGGKTDGEVLDILAAWLNDSATRHSSDVLVSILRCMKMLPVTTAALERTGLGKSVKKLKKYVHVPQADDENAAESKEAAEKVPKLSDQLFERWKQKALEELERSENEKRTEAANKKRKLEREKKEAEKATEKEKKKAKVQLKEADDIDDVIKKQKKDVTQKETKTTTTTVTRTVVSRPAIIAPAGTTTPTTTETLKKRKAREPVASAATDATKPKQTKIGSVSASMLYNSASKESSKKIGVPSALLALQTKKEKKVKKAYFETHLPYSDDPNEVKFKHKSERDAEDGKAKPKKKKSLTWASSDELEQRKIYVPDPNDWLIKYDDKSAGMDVDDDSDASVEAALKRKAREEESERNAAAKARKRKMEQMRATTSWKIPKDIPRDPELNIACGEDSRELHRIAGIVARKKAAVYKDRKEVPDSPAEAPKEKANEDEMLEIPIQLAVEPAQQQPQQQPAPPPPQPQQMQYQHPPPPPVHQQQGPPIYTQPPQAGMQFPPPPPPPQQQQSAAPQLNQAAIQALLNQFNRPAGGPPPSAGGFNMPPPGGTAPPPPTMTTRAPAVSHARAGVVTSAAKSHPRGVCAFFNSATGCSWGDKCGFLHQVGLTAEKPKKNPGPGGAAAPHADINSNNTVHS